MINLTTSILIILCFFSLSIGCSFSKEAKKDSLGEQQQVTGERIVTPTQQRLFNAIRANNLQSIKQIIASLTSKEMDFSELQDTPAGLAVKYNLPDVLQLLKELEIDTWNLGEHGAKFEDRFFQQGLKSNYLKINHSDAAKFKDMLNSAEKILASEYQKYFDKIFDHLSSNNIAAATGTMEISKLSCKMAAQHILLKAQQNDLKSFRVFESFLKQPQCDIASKDLQQLYQFELIRQFRSQFESPEILSYFFRHESLVNTMWNIDESGIWISPQVILRIAFSAENIGEENGQRRYRLCKPRQDGRHPICFGVDQEHQPEFETDGFLKSLGYKRPTFEVIDARPGKPTYSFIYLPHDYENTEDIFFKTVSTYMRQQLPPDQKSEEKKVDWKFSYDDSKESNE